MVEFKETIISRLWQRLNDTAGKVSIARNAKVEPSSIDMPAIRFFELPDEVTKHLSRGSSKYPAYQRTLTVVIELFIKASEEGAATKELFIFVRDMKKKLYEGGNTLGLKGCQLFEVEASKVFRPPVGDPVAGIAIIIEIHYIEDISLLFI